MLQRLDHVADEAFAVHVSQPRIRVAFLQFVGHRVHEMGLAQADAAVDEQRVVSLAGIAGHLDRGRLGELVALSLDEGIEGEIRVDAAAHDDGRHPPCSRRGLHAIGHRGRRVAARRAGIRRPGTGAHIQHEIRRRAVREGMQKLSNPRQRIFTQPLDDVAIRRQQANLPFNFNGLQRPHPGVELLHREFALEHTQTAVPQRLRQERSPKMAARGRSNERAGSLAPTRRCVY